MSTAGSKLSRSKEETRAFGLQIGREVEKGSLIALFGELGSGKTTFVEGLVEGVLGRAFAISSPTFNYLNIYEEQIFHFDLYRLEKAEHFFEMGFEEFFFSGITCIEWSERIESYLPEETKRIFFNQEGENRWLTSDMFAS